MEDVEKTRGDNYHRFEGGKKIGREEKSQEYPAPEGQHGQSQGLINSIPTVHSDRSFVIAFFYFQYMAENKIGSFNYFVAKEKSSPALQYRNGSREGC